MVRRFRHAATASSADRPGRYPQESGWNTGSTAFSSRAGAGGWGVPEGGWVSGEFLQLRAARQGRQRVAGGLECLLSLDEGGEFRLQHRLGRLAMLQVAAHDLHQAGRHVPRPATAASPWGAFTF